MRKVTASCLYLLLVVLIFPYWIKAQENIQGVSKAYSIQLAPTPKYPPQLVITSLKFADKDGNQVINANESAKITFQIENNGQGTAYGVMPKVDETSGLQGIDIIKENDLIEKIEPEQSRKIEVELTATGQIETGVANLQIDAVDANGFSAAPQILKVNTQAFQPPQLHLADYLFSSNTRKIQKSTPITLRLAIQNKGIGEAENVTVSCQLPKNVFAAGETSFSKGNLAYAEDVQVDLEFFTNSQYAATTIPIKVTVTESYGRYGFTQTVEATLEENASNNQRLTVVQPTSKPKTLNPIAEIRLQSEVDKNIPTLNFKNEDAIAVVIGNRDYAQASNVDYALNDALVMKKYLIGTMGFRPGNIFYYENATLSDFRTLFGTEKNHKGKIYNSMKHHASDVFVFYSGHGAPGLADKNGYFVPTNSDPNYVESTGYPLKVFYENLGKLPSKHITVVTDACFSGADVYEEISPIVIKTRPQAALLEKGVVFNSSSGDQVSSWYTENQHGLFTWAFLKALQDYEATDINNDRKVTVQEIYKRIADNNEGVPYYARLIHGIEQVPVLKGNDTNRVLFEY